MRTKLLSVVVGIGIAVGTVSPAHAQVRDLPAGCNVDPNRTRDPAAVAAAQRDVRAFLLETALTYSQQGYATQAAMIATEGNAQTDWYDKALALACGRLVGGFKGRSWVPGMGWQ